MYLNTVWLEILPSMSCQIKKVATNFVPKLFLNCWNLSWIIVKSYTVGTLQYRMKLLILTINEKVNNINKYDFKI